RNKMNGQYKNTFFGWRSVFNRAHSLYSARRVAWKDRERFREDLLAGNVLNPDSTIGRIQIDLLEREYRWLRRGGPYYNIHPEMSIRLGKTNLKKVPLRFIEMPHGYESVVLNFRRDDPNRPDLGIVGVSDLRGRSARFAG